MTAHCLCSNIYCQRVAPQTSDSTTPSQIGEDNIMNVSRSREMVAGLWLVPIQIDLASFVAAQIAVLFPNGQAAWTELFPSFLWHLNLLIHWEVVYSIDMPITCQFELVKCIVHVAVCEWKKKEKRRKKKVLVICFGVVVRGLTKFLCSLLLLWVWPSFFVLCCCCGSEQVSLFSVAAVGLSIVGGRSLSFQLLFLCWNSWDSPTAV